MKASAETRGFEVISADDRAQTLHLRLEGLDSFTVEAVWHDGRPPAVLHVYAHRPYSGLVLTATAGMDKVIIGLPSQLPEEHNGVNAQLLATELSCFPEFSFIPEA